MEVWEVIAAAIGLGLALAFGNPIKRYTKRGWEATKWEMRVGLQAIHDFIWRNIRQLKRITRRKADP